jgi:hypothetical protein
MTVLSMRENYKIFEPVLKNILGANQLEETSRTLIDIMVLMHTHKYKETFTVLVYE